MERLRVIPALVAVGLLAVSGGLAFGIQADGFLWWLTRGTAVFAAIFACSLGLLFVNTFLTVRNGDLWDTVLFKYMRALWGDLWGGPEKRFYNFEWVRVPKQISLCRSAWLAFFTVLSWLFVAGTYLSIAITYMNIFIGSDREFSSVWSFLWSNRANGFAWDLISIFVSAVLLSVLAGVFTPVGKAFPRFSKTVLYGALSCLAFWLVAIGVVGPMRVFGIEAYGSVTLFMLSVAGVVGIVVGMMFGAIFLIRKLGRVSFSQLVRDTFVGVLAERIIEGIKNKTCPLIIEKLQDEESGTSQISY